MGLNGVRLAQCVFRLPLGLWQARACLWFLLRLTAFQAALLRCVMRLTFSGCLIFHRQPETHFSDAKTVYAILR